jgi:hypothetical protein
MVDQVAVNRPEHPASFEVSGDDVRNVDIAGNMSVGTPAGVRVSGRLLDKINVRRNRHQQGSKAPPNWAVWASLVLGVLGIAAAILVPLFLG